MQLVQWYHVISGRRASYTEVNDQWEEVSSDGTSYNFPWSRRPILRFGRGWSSPDLASQVKLPMNVIWHSTQILRGDWSGVQLRSDPTTTLGHRTDNDDYDDNDDGGNAKVSACGQKEECFDWAKTLFYLEYGFGNIKLATSTKALKTYSKVLSSESLCYS